MVAQARDRGATFVSGHARPHGPAALVGDELFEADAIVWACGPCLAELFPELIAQRATQQDTFFFIVSADWQTPRTPACLDQDADVYGVADLGSGFKLATGWPGGELDLDREKRELSTQASRAAHMYLTRRFPALSAAPLVGGQPCPSTARSRTVAAHHPEYPSVWIVGGGGGMFKHAPVLAEHVADLMAGGASPKQRFALPGSPS